MLGINADGSLVSTKVYIYTHTFCMVNMENVSHACDIPQSTLSLLHALNGFLYVYNMCANINNIAD